MFHPTLGRWLTPDPIGFEGQDPNLYGFVRNNPVNLTDPSGLAPNQKGATDPDTVIQAVRRRFKEFSYELHVKSSGAKYQCVSMDKGLYQLLSKLSDDFQTNDNRYFYTTQYGWVDTRHFFASAATALRHGENIAVGLGFGLEVVQWITEGENSYKSGFSPEDLPSNSAGASLAGKLRRSPWERDVPARYQCYMCITEDQLVAFVKWWMEKNGAKTKNDPAAGFGNLPVEDPSNPPGTNRGSNSSSGPVQYPLPLQRPARPVVINPGGCFVADTPVLTATGYKLVQVVQVGDKVPSWDEKAKEFVLQPVAALYRTSKTVLYRVTGPEWDVSCSAEHPFLTDDGGWKMVSEMRVGDWVRTRAGRPTRVKSLERLSFDYNVPLFNFEVENTHNYCVTYTGVVVHNKPP